MTDNIKAPKEIRIFYSWQSDSNPASNKNFIRKALSKVAGKIEKNNLYTIKNDEATRDVPGSPPIPLTIMEKINVADIFIADVTTIGKSYNGKRMLPNPNVVFEFGYAVATLGWGRIVLLFNESSEKLEDLPFDYDRNRVTRYTASISPSEKEMADLIGHLETAVRTIIEHNPKRPLVNQSPEQIKRSTDIENLRWLISSIHIPTLEYHIADLPERIHGDVFHCWEEFSAITRTKLFHIYDPELKKKISSFCKSFISTLSHGDCYKINDHGIYTYSALPETRSGQEYLDIERDAEEMKESLSDFLAYVRENYLEINIRDESARAFDNIRRFQQGDS